MRAPLTMQSVLRHMWPDDGQLRDLVAGGLTNLFALVDGQGRMAGPAALRPVIVDLVHRACRPQVPMMLLMTGLRSRTSLPMCLGGPRWRGRRIGRWWPGGVSRVLAQPGPEFAYLGAKGGDFCLQPYDECKRFFRRRRRTRVRLHTLTMGA